jgi:hypothetical protein
MCITNLKRFLRLNVLVGQFLPMVFRMARDRLADVKFMAAKTVLLFSVTNDQMLHQQIQACIQALHNVPDVRLSISHGAWSSNASELTSGLSILEWHVMSIFAWKTLVVHCSGNVFVQETLHIRGTVPIWLSCRS